MRRGHDRQEGSSRGKGHADNVKMCTINERIDEMEIQRILRDN